MLRRACVLVTLVTILCLCSFMFLVSLLCARSACERTPAPDSFLVIRCRSSFFAALALAQKDVCTLFTNANSCTGTGVCMFSNGACQASLYRFQSIFAPARSSISLQPLTRCHVNIFQIPRGAAPSIRARQPVYLLVCASGTCAAPSASRVRGWFSTVISLIIA